ncbi:hypothetical protein CC80DRAFT_598811 [Byssothecium circinans]|uniref:Uncharacterized protein n=1 Tax=Byssothecium circinans TaxID=147558 RepID=A0A6A5TB21_9PLEO|nr:hypothetical protein CC80DRAFT_598811 [Byssothecium circinans]
MKDTTQSTLLPPDHSSPFGSATPSGLTPNTRSEAEAALYHNTVAQTDSAAPTTPLADANLTEAQKAYRRPQGTIRTSSTNYEAALREAHAQASASSDLSTSSTSASTETETETETPRNVTDGMKVDSPVGMGRGEGFPPPGQGVVPRHASIGSGQMEIVRKAKPTGLSLGDLGRKQSWSSQDMKHVMQGALMSPEVGKGEPGYESSGERGD